MSYLVQQYDFPFNILTFSYELYLLFSCCFPRLKWLTTLMQHPDDRISPAQDGVLRVQARIFRAASDSKDKTLVSRLLVSSGQIGCLLGRGGAIIAEMRKLSGAYIRILGKDQIPSCASENEEVVQVDLLVEISTYT